MYMFNVRREFPATPDLNLDLNDICCMGMDQGCRESRGSISFTDYYSNEDGQIPKICKDDKCKMKKRSPRVDDATFIDNIDEDEDHTLTLRQSEEQKKQDIKFIFEPQENPNPVSSSSSFKKIGRWASHPTSIVLPICGKLTVV